MPAEKAVEITAPPTPMEKIKLQANYNYWNYTNIIFTFSR
jgi:hypothetical protein